MVASICLSDLSGLKKAYYQSKSFVCVSAQTQAQCSQCTLGVHWGTLIAHCHTLTRYTGSLVDMKMAPQWSHFGSTFFFQCVYTD